MSDSGQFRDEHERQLDAIIARYYRAVEEGLPRCFERWTLPQIGEQRDQIPDAVVWLIRYNMNNVKQSRQDESGT